MKIGFFDSGLGGLSVLHRARRMMPHGDFIYYADEEHVPYGSRERSEIVAFTRDAVRCMADMGAGAVVIACNTATSAAVKVLRQEFTFPIIGMEPAVKTAVEHAGGRRVLVAATAVTIAGEKMHDLVETVDKSHLVDTVDLGGLVPFAERGEFDSDAVKDYIRRSLLPFSGGNYGSFVLGCTHFNYFKEAIRAAMPEVTFVDGNEGTVRQTKRRMDLAGISAEGNGETQYVFSGRIVTEKEELSRIGRCMAQLDRVFDI